MTASKVDLAALGIQVRKLEWKDEKALFPEEGPTYSEAVGAGYTYVAEAVDMTLGEAKASRQAAFEESVAACLVPVPKEAGVSAEEMERVLAEIGRVGLQGAKRAYIGRLVTGMVTRSATHGGNSRPLAVNEVADRIARLGLADWDQPLCWIDRDGLVMPAYQFAHEWVLHWLGMDTRDAEDRGWVRNSQSGWQCLYKVSPAQRKALRARGHAVERAEEADKRPWHGLPPFDPSIHPSRRVR